MIVFYGTPLAHPWGRTGRSPSNYTTHVRVGILERMNELLDSGDAWLGLFSCYPAASHQILDEGKNQM